MQVPSLAVLCRPANDSQSCRKLSRSRSPSAAHTVATGPNDSRNRSNSH